MPTPWAMFALNSHVAEAGGTGDAVVCLLGAEPSKGFVYNSGAIAKHVGSCLEWGILVSDLPHLTRVIYVMCHTWVLGGLHWQTMVTTRCCNTHQPCAV